MTFDYHRLKYWPFEEVVQSCTARDSIRYALSIGIGADPMNEVQMPYVFEESGRFAAVPTIAVVLGSPGFWAHDPETGTDWVRILHGEQKLELHRPLPTAATVKTRTRAIGIVDKGAPILTERAFKDAVTYKPLTTLTSTTFAHGNGGYGGPSDPAPEPHALPDRDPNLFCDLSTLERAALIYRPSGDYNPLHTCPVVARTAGFEKPILHGVRTLGVAGHRILRSCCDYDATRFRSLQLRFSAPIYPGETIRTEMWRDGPRSSFRASAVERAAVVLSNGLALAGT